MNKLWIAIAVAICAIWVVARRLAAPDVTVATPEPGSRSMNALAPIEAHEGSRGPAIAAIQKQREQFKAEAALRIALFRPKVEKDHYVFTLRYKPVMRACVNGDIDLIRRSVSDTQTLSWVWQDQNGKAVMAPRTVRPSQLGQTFTQAIHLPVSEKPRFYKLALCLGKGPCSKAPAVDFARLEGRKPIVLQEGLFFAQNFRVDATGIRIFDSREYKDPEAYKNWQAKIDDDRDAQAFVEQMLEQQKTIRSLPVAIAGSTLDVELYVRQDKGCR